MRTMLVIMKLVDQLPSDLIQSFFSLWSHCYRATELSLSVSWLCTSPLQPLTLPVDSCWTISSTIQVPAKKMLSLRHRCQISTSSLVFLFYLENRKKGKEISE
ncbi:hypothetical protein BC332_33962 [Capsicum chinense]|nr:hypothetical protein BC332_33962 [Capsicum chinense]